MKVLLGAKPEAFKDSIVEAVVGETEQRFKNVGELREHYSDDKVIVEKQSFNLVKKCSNCGKPNAVTLENCNNCGEVLPTEYSRTDNIMYCFVFATRFPISLRAQTLDTLVYDDLLSLSRCHLNAINTETYVPDIRFLFKHPKQGLEIVQGLMNQSAEVIKSQFFSNEGFMEKMFSKVKKKDDFDNLIASFAVMGFNCPPSQFLLHLQTVLLPLTPFQFHNYMQGNHFTEGRWFPAEYVKRCLELDVAIPEVTETTKVEEIIKFFSDKGINYNEIYKKEYKKVETAQKKLDAWKEEDFLGFYDAKEDMISMQNESGIVGTFKEVGSNRDKDILQNYGRPYAEDGQKKNLGYYKFFRETLMKPFGGTDEVPAAAKAI